MKLIISFIFVGLFLSRISLASDVLTGITLSPFVLATKISEGITVGIGKIVSSTMSLVQSRSFAEREELRDQLLEMNKNLIQNPYLTFESMPDGILKELFFEILSDEEKLAEVRGLVREGSAVYKLTTAVLIILFFEV
jgi:hypothetical protein